MDRPARSARYGRRMLRTVGMVATRTVPLSSFRLALRPRQVALPACGLGMVFYDRDTERMAFGEKG